jgi:predicted anti-sigma-YlaC factor YlaD
MSVGKLSCQEASRLLSDELDRPLSAEQRERLRLHLVVCEACRNIEEQLALMHEALRRLGRRDAPADKPR